MATIVVILFSHFSLSLNQVNNNLTMLRQLEFDLLTNKPQGQGLSAADYCGTKHDPLLDAVEAHVERTRSEELEKRLQCQLSNHWTSTSDYQAK